MTTPLPSCVVWCDVGPEVGIGHVMRCLALAEELALRGTEVTFLADLAQVDFARDAVESRGFAWEAPDPDVARRVARVRELRPAAVVVDSYRTPVAAYAELRAAFPVLALVDGSTVTVDGDVLLDQNLGAESEDHASPPGSLRLAGLRHALLRRDVREAAARRGHETPRAASRAPRVLAFFGGTDAFGAAPVATDLLLSTTRPLRLRVVAARPEVEAAVAALGTGAGQHVEVIAPTDALTAEVLAADLVVAAAGSSSWELLCLGAACAFVGVAGNQDLALAGLEAAGAGAVLGRLEDLRHDEARRAGARRALTTLLDDPAAREQLRRAGTSLVDGQGPVRVADALEGVVRRRADRGEGRGPSSR